MRCKASLEGDLSPSQEIVAHAVETSVDRREAMEQAKNAGLWVI